ncbi:hypothetical protein GBAR_LOCUS14691 [Geodia barretti]|uniref:Uncharacterized protein n=1 Tax=Geodia barretti TaxID=519541 RepID=A0AA35SBB9_GEOBA|nr:hypothetical protein GBAR_LOCUS14691 [Geodia barretti]
MVASYTVLFESVSSYDRVETDPYFKIIASLLAEDLCEVGWIVERATRAAGVAVSTIPESIV